MKKTIMSVIIAGAVLGGSSSAFAASATVNDQWVNFRSAPTTKGSTIYRALKPGSSIEVLETTNKWWVKANVNGRVGYVSQDYITLALTQVTPAPTQSKAADIIAYGKTFMGTPYLFGGSTPAAFDCSGFLHYIYAANGVNITRQSTTSAARDGYIVSRDQLQPGDLIYFYSPIHHIGMYIGDNKILHTAGAGGVKVSDIGPGSWYYNKFTTAKRVL